MAGRPQRSAKARAFGMGILPQAQRSRVVHMPAPVGGINTVSPASMMGPTDCLSAYNLIPFEYGLRTRSGWREHATGVGSDYVARYGLSPHSGPLMDALSAEVGGDMTGVWPGVARTGVRTMISFYGSDSRGLNDRLFACTASGIWDVTDPGTKTAPVYGASDGWVTDRDAGYGVGTSFTNANGDHYYAYCDGTNGYLLYSEKTGAWTKVVQGTGTGQINGADPASFRHVMAWKNRLWFTQANTARAYYLPVGQYAGDVSPINFGSQFRFGGTLVGLWNWTVDGGVGIDDQLVAISTSGDVVIYVGTDPSSVSTFGIKGKWWVGQVPPGRRIASSFGGDLFILSLVGCVPLSKLVSGGLIRDPNILASGKVSNLFNALMTDRGQMDGWEINIHPTDNMLIVNVPAMPDKVQEQLTMSMASKGWTRNVGVPISCMEPWRGKLYFGTPDNRVCVHDGHADGVKLDGTGAKPIFFSMLSSFQNMGNAQKKRLHMVRPLFITDGNAPGFAVEARWDFNLKDASPSGVYVDPMNIAGWDVDKWDAGEWAEDVSTAGHFYGALGMGTHLAVVLRGSAMSIATLVGFDVVADSGGIL